MLPHLPKNGPATGQQSQPHEIGAFQPGSPPVALRAPSGGPGAIPSSSDSFRIPQLHSQTRFNPKFVPRKIGGGSDCEFQKFISRLAKTGSSFCPDNPISTLPASTPT